MINIYFNQSLLHLYIIFALNGICITCKLDRCSLCIATINCGKILILAREGRAGKDTYTPETRKDACILLARFPRAKIRELKQGRRQRQRWRRKAMIWLVEWGKPTVLRAQQCDYFPHTTNQINVFWCRRYSPPLGSLRKHVADGSENVIWKCNFVFLQSFLNYSKSLHLKMCSNYPGTKLEQALQR